MSTLEITPTSFTDPIINGINTVLPKLPGVLFGLLLGILVLRLLSRVLRLLLKLTTLQQGLRDVIISIVEIIFWVILTIWILQALGFSSVIVFFSSSAIALGLLLSAGGSTLISDIVAGIFLARDTDFNVGDEVIAGETPTQGVIESMDARRTRIRDSSGVLHVLPNSVVERREWVVIHRRQELHALVRAVKSAREIRTTAIEKTIARKVSNASRKNNQSQTGLR